MMAEGQFWGSGDIFFRALGAQIGLAEMLPSDGSGEVFRQFLEVSDWINTVGTIEAGRVGRSLAPDFEYLWPDTPINPETPIILPKRAGEFPPATASLGATTRPTIATLLPSHGPAASHPLSLVTAPLPASPAVYRGVAASILGPAPEPVADGQPADMFAAGPATHKHDGALDLLFGPLGRPAALPSPGFFPPEERHGTDTLAPLAVFSPPPAVSPDLPAWDGRHFAAAWPEALFPAAAKDADGEARGLSGLTWTADEGQSWDGAEHGRGGLSSPAARTLYRQPAHHAFFEPGTPPTVSRGATTVTVMIDHRAFERLILGILDEACRRTVSGATRPDSTTRLQPAGMDFCVS